MSTREAIAAATSAKLPEDVRHVYIRRVVCSLARNRNGSRLRLLPPFHYDSRRHRVPRCRQRVPASRLDYCRERLVESRLLLDFGRLPWHISPHGSNGIPSGSFGYVPMFRVHILVFLFILGSTTECSPWNEFRIGWITDTDSAGRRLIRLQLVFFLIPSACSCSDA